MTIKFFKNTAVRGEVELNFIKLRELVAIYLPEKERDLYLGMMNALAPDIQEQDILYLGLKRAPAASGNHHAFEGGLVYHLMEMWAIWEHLRTDFERDPYINDVRILKAIINHDLHKAYRTYVLDTEAATWRTYYGTDVTDQLLTSDTKSIWLLMQHGIVLDPEQMNALLLAEGGFAKIKPKQATALSKLAYCLDELSGNVASRIYTSTLIDLKRVVP